MYKNLFITGERVVVRKRGIVELVGGGPDCTATFESDCSLLKATKLPPEKHHQEGLPTKPKC